MENKSKYVTEKASKKTGPFDMTKVEMLYVGIVRVII